MTQLLLSLVRSGEIDGALLVRPQTAKPILQEYFVARTEPEILGAQGSVYAPVSTAGIGSLISEHPGEARLALVGLPCVISGIRWLSQSKREALSNIALFVGLFCGRTPNLYATEYLLRRLKVSPSQVRRINYRSEGWPGNIQITRVDDQVSEVPYKSTYGMKTLLSSNLFLPKACYFCNDALARYADIAWGDAWLHRLSDDNNGYSLAVCHTEKGKEVLHRYQAELSLQPLPRHDLFEAQGRLMHSKTVGYAHRLWLYLKLRPSLHGLLQPPKFTFSLPVFIRETAFMPVYLLSRRLGVFRWRRLPFPVLRFYKLMARVWR